MRRRDDYTEITVVAEPGEGPEARPQPVTGPLPEDYEVELTVVAGSDRLPTLIATARQPQESSRAAQPAEPQAPPGRADLDLLDLIGQGAMGQVILARDLALRRRVAYKRLRPELSGDAGVARRLLAEAQITAQLDHPNVVPLYRLEQDGTQPIGYLMKLVEGDTLAALVERARAAVEGGRPLPPGLTRDALLEHFLKVCDAVAFAHAKGVIHRDLKPSNVMVGRFNEVYAMDWGIARVLALPDVLPRPEATSTEGAVDTIGQGRDPTADGSLVGTPRYMSPEQARGEVDRLDPRSDLYALGLILYELVCLRPAFQSHGTDGLLDRVRRGERGPIVAPGRRLAVPAELRAIVEKATRAVPEERYPSVAALASDLRSFLRGESVGALRDNAVRKALRWIGHHRQAALSLFLAALLLAGLASGALWYRHVLAMREMRDYRELTNRFLSLATARAQAIEQHFTWILGQLEGLSVGAELALESKAPVDTRIYTGRDFDSPETSPADLAPTGHYAKRPISTDHPVALLPRAGADPATLLKVRRLVALTPLFQRIFLEANGERDPRPSGPRVREALSHEEVYIGWLGIGLREGALVRYPGVGGLDHDDDPALSPWYRQALPGKGSGVCGEPDTDPIFGNLNLPCSVGLYSTAGELLGVAYVALPLGVVLAELLQSSDLPQTRALLLNEQGRVIVEVHEGKGDAMTRPPMRPYDDPGVVRAARLGQSGLHERVDNGRKLWVAYIRLPELKWTYVTELHASAEGQPTR